MCECVLLPSGYEGKTFVPVASDSDNVSMQSPRTQLKSIDDVPESPFTASTASSASFDSRTWSEDTLESDQSCAPSKGVGLDKAPQDDYEAFLRDMAGSFEATYNDEESDEEEDEGKADHGSASDDNDDDEDIGSEQKQDSKQVDYDAFLREMAGSYQQEATDDEDSEDSEANSDDEDDLNAHLRRQLSTSSQPAGNQVQSAPGKVPPSPLWAGDRVVARLANGQLKHLDDRAPVPDSYDMAAATAPLDPPSLELPESIGEMEAKRVALEETIRLRKQQASKLLAMSRKEHLSAPLRAQYGNLGAELTAELDSLQKELDMLLFG